MRAYGDQHVEVRKNGVLIDPESDGVEGGASYTPSPNQAEPHTMYEIRVPASPGRWGVQLHDPGPTFNCHVIEQEPHPMQGDLRSDGEGDEGSSTTTIDISEPVAPDDVTLFAPFDEMTVNPPVKLVWQTREGLDFTIYQVQIATDDTFTVKSRVLDVGTYSSSFDVPVGLLKAGKTYYWHVIAWNTEGSTTSATRSFTVFGEGEEPLPDGGAGGNDGGEEPGPETSGVEFQWVKDINGPISPQHLAVDPETGETVAVGIVSSTIDFGNGVLIPPNEDSPTAFIVKYDKDGHALWSKLLGEGFEYHTQIRVAIDDNGNVVVAGSFVDSLQLVEEGEALTSAGSSDIFLAKYTKTGAHIWSKRFGGALYDKLGSIAVDGAGSIFLTGVFVGTIDFGEGHLVGQGNGDIFVVQLDSSGDHVNSKRFGDANSQDGLAIALDGSGNVIVSGSFVGTLDCGLDMPITSEGGENGYVMKLGATLDCVWQYRHPTVGSNYLSSLVITPSNDIFAADNIGSLTKLTSSGGHVWSKDPLPTFGLGHLSSDGAGGVALTGRLSGAGDFGGGVIGFADSTENVFFVAYDGAGNHVASKAVRRAQGAAIVRVGSAQYFAIGNFYDGADFGNGAYSDYGMFASKLTIAP